MDKIFNKPFAVNGARVAIPENGTENERVSFDKGFTQPYEVEAPSVDNPAGQGFNILRPEMNEILNQLSNACNLLAENIDKWVLLTTENLNDIKQAGRYYQPFTTQATTDRNYPVNVAGYLIVLNTNISSYGVTQIYKQWNNERIFIRRTTSTTAWGSWDSFVLNSEFNNKITSLQNTDTNLNNNKEDKTRITFEAILEGADLNNYTTQGFYCLQSNDKAGVNFPERTAGYLFVFKRGTTDNYYQVYYTYDSTAIYIRNKEGGNWTSWKKIVLWNDAEAAYRKIADSYTKTETNNLLNQKEDKTKFTNGVINNTTNSNLDNLTQNGFYWRATNTGSPLPTTNGGAVIVNTNGSQVIQYFYTDTWSSYNGGAWFRTRNASGTWTDWHHLENSEHANSTYRKIADSYTKAQCDSTFLTIANANSTYRKIADSYTKAEVYTKTETDSKTIGINQTWQKPSRANNTQYTNNTGKPIMVAITFKSANEHANGTCDFYVNNLIIASEDQRYIHIGRHAFSFIVPPGATYKVNCTGDFSIYLWIELR